MKFVRVLLIGLGAAGFILAALAVLLFNRSAFGWQALSVPTGSMRPAMPPGSVALVHSVPLSSLKVGDVITHVNPLSARTTLTHRIIKEYKVNGRLPVFVTKGDANPSPDPAVVGGLVRGKMVWHVSHVGELMMWAKTWAGITILIYLPALIIIINETRRLAAYLRQIKPYRLEGWRTGSPDGDEQQIQAVPAMAASILATVVIIGAGWQTVGAAAPRAQRTPMLVLTHNILTARAGVGATPKTNTRAGSHVPDSQNLSGPAGRRLEEKPL